MVLLFLVFGFCENGTHTRRNRAQQNEDNEMHRACMKRSCCHLLLSRRFTTVTPRSLLHCRRFFSTNYHNNNNQSNTSLEYFANNFLQSQQSQQQTSQASSSPTPPLLSINDLMNKNHILGQLNNNSFEEDEEDDHYMNEENDDEMMTGWFGSTTTTSTTSEASKMMNHHFFLQVSASLSISELAQIVERIPHGKLQVIPGAMELLPIFTSESSLNSRLSSLSSSPPLSTLSADSLLALVFNMIRSCLQVDHVQHAKTVLIEYLNSLTHHYLRHDAHYYLDCVESVIDFLIHCADKPFLVTYDLNSFLTIVVNHQLRHLQEQEQQQEQRSMPPSQEQEQHVRTEQNLTQMFQLIQWLITTTTKTMTTSDGTSTTTTIRESSLRQESHDNEESEWWWCSHFATVLQWMKTTLDTSDSIFYDYVVLSLMEKWSLEHRHGIVHQNANVQIMKRTLVSYYLHTVKKRIWRSKGMRLWIYRTNRTNGPIRSSYSPAKFIVNAIGLLRSVVGTEAMDESANWFKLARHFHIDLQAALNQYAQRTITALGWDGYGWELLHDLKTHYGWKPQFFLLMRHSTSSVQDIRSLLDHMTSVYQVKIGTWTLLYMIQALIRLGEISMARGVLSQVMTRVRSRELPPLTSNQVLCIVKSFGSSPETESIVQQFRFGRLPPTLLHDCDRLVVNLWRLSTDFQQWYRTTVLLGVRGDAEPQVPTSGRGATHAQQGKRSRTLEKHSTDDKERKSGTTTIKQHKPR